MMNEEKEEETCDLGWLSSSWWLFSRIVFFFFHFSELNTWNSSWQFTNLEIQRRWASLWWKSHVSLQILTIVISFYQTDLSKSKSWLICESSSVAQTRHLSPEQTQLISGSFDCQWTSVCCSNSLFSSAVKMVEKRMQ